MVMEGEGDLKMRIMLAISSLVCGELHRRVHEGGGDLNRVPGGLHGENRTAGNSF